MSRSVILGLTLLIVLSGCAFDKAMKGRNATDLSVLMPGNSLFEWLLE